MKDTSEPAGNDTFFGLTSQVTWNIVVTIPTRSLVLLCAIKFLITIFISSLTQLDLLFEFAYAEAHIESILYS